MTAKKDENSTAAAEVNVAQAAPAEGTAEWLNEKVTIRLFKDNQKYKDDVFVAVNGKGWQIQRGVDVQVPRYVAQVLKQSEEQDAKTARLIEEKANEWRQSVVQIEA